MSAVNETAARGPLRGAGLLSTDGDSASAAALTRLRQELAAAKAAKKSLPHLKKALAAVQAERFAEGVEEARAGVAADPKSALGWHLLAISLEKQGELLPALDAFESALQIQPESPEIANDLGRLAFKLKMYPQAETLFRYHLSQRPHAHESANNLACVLREQMRFGEAIELLQGAIQASPENVTLWNTLGTVLSEQGQTEQAIVFYSEALRLDPGHARARYNRSNALAIHGDMAEAIAECRLAMEQASTPDDRAMMRFALSSLLLAAGELGEGWDAYEARFDRHFADPIAFLAGAQPWKPFEDLRGKRMLVVGEQGLGDEVSFANLLPDIVEAVGPEGEITLSIEQRLVPLFQRSFPSMKVSGHKTVRHGHRAIRAIPGVKDWKDVDRWAPIGSLLREFRTSPSAFPERPQGFLRADPQRVAYWRGVLNDLPPGPRVGLLWTSMLMNSSRRRAIPLFEEWEAVLKTPGVVLVNLQYGDCSDAINKAEAEFGVRIHQPPGIDLKVELDDAAALSCAMDLVVGISNANLNLAAACGAPTWIIRTPGDWRRLGTERYPWYSQARVFVPPAFNEWGPLLGEVAVELQRWAEGFAGTEARAAG